MSNALGAPCLTSFVRRRYALLKMNRKKPPAEFIVFAVKQAKEAQAFGFTRNECCRNLKTALHQYWQNKTLGLHGQSQKARIPRSNAAVGRPLTECVVEHVVPQMAIVNRLMDMEILTEATVIEFLSKCFAVILVTHEEHVKLNASGLRSTMPHGWDGSDIFARYAAVGIKLAPPSIPNDRNA